ncbi:MAG: hypothetical protein OXT74_10535 [Candidatus Poribacteria bacterium]|nr:hypothetical protein [Candidatus Poribacteria bacterium]
MRTIHLIFLCYLIIGIACAINSIADPVKIVAVEKHHDDGFGFTVALSGDYAIVASPRRDAKGGRSGVVYPFARSGNNWKRGAPPEFDGIDTAEGDEFGRSVSMSGNTTIIGAAGHDTDRKKGAGAAYVFVGPGPRHRGRSWKQQAKLSAQDAAAGDQFGWSVGIDKNTAIVGSRFDDDIGKNSGSAYIFVRDGDTWNQQAKLKANDGAASDNFGHFVAIRGDVVIVGAPKHAHKGLKQSGAAYIFTRDGERWVQTVKLAADEPVAKDQFGASLSISDDIAIVGAPLKDGTAPDAGAAYVFVRDGDLWTQQAKLAAQDGEKFDQFGNDVSISNNIILIGAKFDDDVVVDGGSAYSFLREGDVWVEKEKVTLPLLDANWPMPHFGISVEIDGQYAIVGADTADNDTGAAYIYKTDEDLNVPFAVDPISLRLTTLGKVKTTMLHQNFPNPFNPETWLPYQLANTAEVSFRIYNVQGGLIRKLELGVQQAGIYLDKPSAAYWDGRNRFGELVPNGIYIYDFHAGSFQASRKMVIIK